MSRSFHASTTSGNARKALFNDRMASLFLHRSTGSHARYARMLFRSCSAASNIAGVILAPTSSSPRCRHPRREFPRIRQCITLHMLHAVMREMPDVERIGEIIEICQFVRNLEFPRFFDIETPVNHIYPLTARNTSLVYILASNTITNTQTEATREPSGRIVQCPIFLRLVRRSGRIRGNFVRLRQRLHTFSAFVEPLQREFGASRGSVSLVFSLAGFLYGFRLGIVSGPLADRFGSRRLAVAGMILHRTRAGGCQRRAQPAGGIRRLRTWCWARRRLRLCAGHWRGTALVCPPSRLCFRSGREWYRRRHAC